MNDNALYEAAQHYLVSERADVDAWKLCAAHIGTNATNVNDAKVMFAEVERAIKADFKLSVMPARWRSAKSTVLAALKAGVPIIDSLGLPKPKSALSGEVRTAVAKTASHPIHPALLTSFIDKFEAMKKEHAGLAATQKSMAEALVLSWALSKTAPSTLALAFAPPFAPPTGGTTIVS